jgi:hypothetical protein
MSNSLTSPLKLLLSAAVCVGLISSGYGRTPVLPPSDLPAVVSEEEPAVVPKKKVSKKKAAMVSEEENGKPGSRSPDSQSESSEAGDSSMPMASQQADSDEPEESTRPETQPITTQPITTQPTTMRPATMRLPRYFAGIVDQQQRMLIQEIQLSYRDRIELLEQELEQLRLEQMTEIEGVLTGAQRKLLDQKRDQSRMARAASQPNRGPAEKDTVQ